MTRIPTLALALAFAFVLTCPASPAAAGGGTDMDFLRAVYLELLHRTPDPSGIRTYTAELSSGRMSRADVRKAILNSPEYAKLHAGSGKPGRAKPAPGGGKEPAGVSLDDIFVAPGSRKPPATQGDLPFRLDEVVWLHENVSSWPVTGKLRSVDVSASRISLDYEQAGKWPEMDGVAGNPWIFVNWNGKWHAATWEWLRPGQKVKNRRAVNGDHIKRAPLNAWSPKSGATYYFMVSSLCRDRRRNGNERTDIVPVVWP